MEISEGMVWFNVYHRSDRQQKEANEALGDERL
jgi:hypothetical protein